MTTRRSRGDGGLHWDQTRQRWIATITTGYTPEGKRVVRKAAGRTKTEARTKLKGLIRDHDDGVAAAERSYTVAQAVTDWPDQWLVEKAASLSTRTVADLKSILRRAITRAQSRDKVRRNVVLLCGTPIGQPGRPSKALTLEQAQALVDHTGGSTMGTYVLMSLLTGARSEELRALTWSHLDLDGRPDSDPPVLPHAMVWRSVRTGGDTKTRKSRRTIALPARCVEALLDHRDRQATARRGAGERWVDNDLVFASATGTPLDSANVRRGFRRVATAAGLDAADWTPRELRHSFVSVLSDAGVPIEQIARLVGHSGGSTVTETVYRKQLRSVIEDGATVIDRVFGRASDHVVRRPATHQQPQRGGPTLH